MVAKGNTYMDLKLRGAVVLITGASRGLGREFALAFAEEGARVAICARDAVKLEDVAAAARARGAECLTIEADLLEGPACQRVIDETAAHFGRLDVLVNNASATVDSTPKSIEVATDAQIMARVNGKMLVAVRCARAALPYMRKAGGGRIVNIGGTAARTTFRPGDLPSEGSGLAQGLGNSSLANFTKYLADEVATHQIAVNTIHPHLIRTDRHAQRVTWQAKRYGVSEKEAEAQIAALNPIGRVLEPADVTPLVLLLASPLSAATTGQAIAVDGGALRGVTY
jgi:NAD(P)-dependent dehydrogenase (short-subunit alcohol dehydrogenase family)